MPPMLALDDWLASDRQGTERGGEGVAFPAGTVIGGSYRLIRPLGEGSMGVVLLAHDEALDRQVAVKFMRSQEFTAGFRERFVGEARAMARVCHPNVVQVHAFGEHECAPYFVMQYIAGQTLEEWLARGPELPSFELGLRILDGLCEGVEAIHAADAVHHDVKPSNILLDDQLRPKIADLGLAVLYREHGSGPGEIIGTPAYMAPEIAFSRNVDARLRSRADVYSLACVAYRLFTGRLPFDGTSNIGVLLQHAMTPVVPPSAVRPDLPAEIDGVLLRALAKEPADRTPSALAFRRELIAASQHEPVRILVAEDDDDFRRALALFLSLQFPAAEIECVRDGAGALAAVERKAPSVAIVDLRMPELDGLELTRLLRERHSTQDMPIIILTACGGADEWKRLSALGANRFLVKPVVLDDVVVLVRRVLGEKRREARARPREQPPAESGVGQAGGVGGEAKLLVS